MKTKEQLMEMSVEELRAESDKHFTYVKAVDVVIAFKLMRLK